MPFYPLAGSPAIDKGMKISAIFNHDPGEHDLVGNQIPLGNGYDFGALEFEN
jgi:hypothetical protein